MFGYITPCLDQLSEEQRTRYQSYYCGLCRALREQSSHSGRVTLSNDMTFLAILLSSLYEPDLDERSLRCPVHPLKRRKIILSPMTTYAADMNLLLMYYKCQDKVMDDHSAVGRAGKSILEPARNRVAQEHAFQASGVENALQALWQEEKASMPNPDRLCNLSGNMLAAVFVPDPEDIWAPLLHSVGAGLGRFVYWMDAWEDREEDRKRDRFNPLETWSDRIDYEDFIRNTLEMLIAEATEAFELLPLEKDLDLLRNVLYSGVWQRYNALRQRNKKEKNHDK